MKKILGLVVALMVLALGANVFAAAFTAGNVVIYRVGDGTQALTNIGNTVFLDEFTTNGTWVQSIMMPTNWYGANAPLITDGGGFAQGLITRSQDGRFIVLTGFGATLGQYTNFSVFSTFASNEVPRVVGLVDGSGSINTKTTLTNALSEEEIRAAASTDGTNLWVGGAGTGIKATTRGSTGSTQVEASVTNIRQINIYSNQLFFTAASGVRSTTNFALPTTTNALVAILPGTATNNTAPFGFAMFNLGGGSSNDTLYVAEGSLTFSDENPGVVLKYSLIGGTNWVNSGSIGAGNAAGLAGFSDNTGVHLFITTGGTATPNATGSLYPFVDTTGFKGNVGTNAGGNDANLAGVTLMPSNFVSGSFNARGIAMAPVGSDPTLNGTANNSASVGPPYGIATIGSFGSQSSFFPSNFVYSEANFGTANFNAVFTGVPSWLTASAGGTLTPGGSLTVTFSINANVTNVAAGTASGNITFKAGTSTAVSRPYSIKVNAFTLAPSTNFTVTGSAGGPFTPSQTYVLSNATGSALSWSVNTAQPWSTLSATAGSLPGFTSTNITYSVTNSAATSLTVGPYIDSITFSNTTGGALLNTITVNLQVGFGIFDNYSTFNQNANIVGQNGWVAYDDAGLTPYQITGGSLVIGPPNICDAGEEPVKDMSSTTVTDVTQNVYAGMLITVTSAVVTPSPPFSFGVEDEVKQQEPVTFGSGLGSPVASGSGYVWACRKNVSPPWVIGTTVRTFGTQYMVIDVSDVANSNTWIYVNPVDNNVGHLTNMVADAFDPPTSDGGNGAGENAGHGEGPGGFFWGQFGQTTCQAGMTVTKLAVSTNYADVYNFLVGVTPPPSGDPFTTWQSNYFSVAELGTPSFSGASADPLGKGMSNTNQFLAGFNPTNSAAYLHIVGISKTNSGADIRVDYLGASGDSTYSPGLASRTNVLEFTAGSGSGNYSSNSFASTGVMQVLSNGVGLGALTNMVDPGGATNVPARYYRVRVLVP